MTPNPCRCKQPEGLDRKPAELMSDPDTREGFGRIYYVECPACKTRGPRIDKTSGSGSVDNQKFLAVKHWNELFPTTREQMKIDRGGPMPDLDYEPEEKEEPRMEYLAFKLFQAGYEACAYRHRSTPRIESISEQWEAYKGSGTGRDLLETIEP